MKHQHSAPQPLPAVINQRRFAVLWMTVISCLMLINSGCVYHVKADPRGPDARSYALVDRLLKLDKKSNQYYGPGGSLIGANESGFTHFAYLSTSSNQYSSTTHGRAKTRRWEEIQDIQVEGAVGPCIMLFGIIDPTYFFNSVKLKFHDGSRVTLADTKPKPEALFPFWISSTNWGEAHETAKAFQTIVESRKQNTGNTPLRKP